jgi:hypothetical protein
MIDRSFFISGLCAFSISVALLPTLITTKSYAVPSPLAVLDMDKDGTLDLSEVKDRASTVFDRLDKDRTLPLRPKKSAVG